eukprot:m.1057861 g.1057861  ORF g.1057861 m.1057861 type:complete len:167 (+) comp24205_c0_seq48:3542-4042(+)
MSSGTSSPSLEDRGGLSPPPHRSPVSSETRAFGGTSLRRSSDGKSVHAALETREHGKETLVLRKQLRELQGSIMDADDKAARIEEQARVLKEEIRRLERNAKREGANLEYLKNVIVAFMTNRIGRDKMLLAIATILQFSPEELRTVQSQTKTSSGGRSWFLGGGGS